MRIFTTMLLLVVQLVIYSAIGYAAYWYGAAESSLECIDREPGVRLWRA